MEAFAALGLAANIAQFLELGAKIFKNAKEIKDAGSTVSTSHLATLAADIDDLSSGIRHQYTSLLPNSHSEEKALCDLASRCSEAADDLTAVLKSTIQSSSKKTTWDSTVAALRMIWHQDRINALGERLSEYRGQLTLRLLMVLNKQQSRGLESVRDDIVEVISVNIRDLVAAVGQGKDETIAAIFKTRSGSSTAISRPAGLNPTKDDSLRTSITYTHDTEATGSGSADVARFQTVTGIENYGQKIMDALHFRGISERRSTILPAHEETFEWVWDDSSHPDVKDVKWDPLGTWLRESNPAKGMCYWTSGKAGSGKSSLLKYAQQDPRLAAYLRDWAGSAQLVISSFYFWYAGTDLQKSHAGLLRALLLDVLNSRPDMAAVLFPDICRAIISGRLEGFLELSLWELKAAFSNLVRSVPHDMRIFFIVDGIDEYVGDYNELCKLLLEATASTSVKALVSSRPISACCDRFRHCPSLRMQDLTRHDIQRYVTDNLGNHHLMTKMEKIEPGVTIKIVDEVVDRASGVFLWIVLVVRNLVLRLQNYDSSATLLKEVARLPPDLEKLYGHMLSSMSKENQILGSKFLQMLLRHMEIGCNYPFTLLQLSFAEENDYEACLKTPFKALAAEVSEWRCEATAGRLRASCCGLCEVQNSPGQSEPWVGFFHRTVVEFLQLDGVWEKVTLLTSNPSLTHSSYFEFDADLALVSSSVAELKAMALQPWHRKGPDKSSDIFLRMLRMLGYEKHLNERVRLAYHDRYLNEMRRAVTYHWHNPEIFPSPEQEAAAFCNKKTGKTPVRELIVNLKGTGQYNVATKPVRVEL
ncbi:hypothetical protein CONLIGDRAFT_676357 [Coniochaeta ligniaria NRRL 30616]|uniref:Uncharacterized protein n=1 Tax=Coniochaeta ligniaria NRRL 30616 TaxID=1408157 RepID=A0A1J7K156_9PEZI|nr:hypothetical protein CONLIGDRAFT_676357 [Coniochaeta ligniaria NRRL 30616]